MRVFAIRPVGLYLTSVHSDDTLEGNGNGGSSYTGIIDMKFYETAVDNKSIMLDSNIATANRLVDASVYHLNPKNFGIYYYDPNDTVNVNKIGIFNNLNIEGVYFHHHHLHLLLIYLILSVVLYIILYNKQLFHKIVFFVIHLILLFVL